MQPKPYPPSLAIPLPPPSDVTKLEDLQNLAATVKAKKGIADNIVARAGITEQGAIDTLTPESLRRSL